MERILFCLFVFWLLHGIMIGTAIKEHYDNKLVKAKDRISYFGFPTDPNKVIYTGVNISAVEMDGIKLIEIKPSDIVW